MPWINGGQQHGADDEGQQPHASEREHLIDERLEGEREHQRAGAVDDHDAEAAGHEPAARYDERPDLRPDVAQLDLGALGGEVRADGFACVA